MAEEATEELYAKGMEHVWFPASAESNLGDHQRRVHYLRPVL